MKKTSIKNTIQFNNRLIIILTVIPILSVTLFFFISVRQYQHIVENVNAANNILKNGSNEINAAVWYVVIGKPDEAESPEAVIQNYKDQLYNLSENSTSLNQQQTAFIAVRTLESIQNYVQEINVNIATSQPVSDSEVLLDEIRNVNEVLDETLQEYVMNEINLSSQKSAEIMNGFYLFCGVEAILVLALISIANYNNKRLNARINQPIHALSEMVSEVANGDLSARTEKPGITELDSLAEDLNKMTAQLDLLFTENTEKQKNLAKSEMKVLQAQITPHFIYNSLDAILTLAQRGEMARVSEIIRALSNFFKITLNNGNEWISVEKEFSHVESYLQILKVRYQALLEFDIDLSPEIKEEITLKMLLQPLVENAMYHGIKNSRRRGFIHISGYQEADQLIFEVQDNGIGMTPKQLYKMLDGMHRAAGEEVEGGYGLFNVYRRLKLYFNEAARIEITSEYQKGTTVRLIVPKTIAKGAG